MEVLLENKNAIIYGGGGSIGGAIARAFAREGTKVFLAGRTLTTLEEVAKDIRSAGGVAETAQDVDRAHGDLKTAEVDLKTATGIVANGVTATCATEREDHP